ncbi:signal peptidase II [Mycobacterium sp. Y57]|uniref:signal peptidase II n=1 Tax=Mycolicibacterium xanthum TaxID=2796469 RepID=UPI001C863965|nr:signal peptidase II [Mycolicibacterium xanthum]MBX7435412.1 signal peptidase II [Mycolicibacterium xanthum]
MGEAVLWLLVGAAAAALLIDQASKGIVRRRLGIDDALGRVPVLQVHRLENRSHGWLRMPTPYAVLVFSAVAAASLAAVLLAQVSGLTAGGLGLTLGGAGGNLVDRLVRGSVTDFIAVGRWPVFNLADVALTVGVCVVPLGLL